MAEEGGYYFFADVHLGADDPDGARERAFAESLRSLPADTKGVFLLGDIFDFWVDYHDVVPRGYVRVLAAIQELAARTDVWFFRGNHDWWVTDYFEKELGVHIVKEPYKVMELGGQTVCMGHGDTLGCTDAKSKLIFHVFRNKACIALLKCLHPRWVFSFAHAWSAHSRKRHTPPPFKAEDSGIYRFVNEFGKDKHIDRYVFGHWHTPGRVSVESGGELILLGAWTTAADVLVL
jgi:UDP-2,3-diacylglucosamine hydrolase